MMLWTLCNVSSLLRYCDPPPCSAWTFFWIAMICGGNERHTFFHDVHKNACARRHQGGLSAQGSDRNAPQERRRLRVVSRASAFFFSCLSSSDLSCESNLELRAWPDGDASGEVLSAPAALRVRAGPTRRRAGGRENAAQ